MKIPAWMLTVLVPALVAVLGFYGTYSILAHRVSEIEKDVSALEEKVGRIQVELATGVEVRSEFFRHRATPHAHTAVKR